MISDFRAGQEITRMSGLEYWSTLTPVAIRELVKALMRADSDIIAVGIVNEWLSERKDRPTPADLHAAVERHNRAARIALRTESAVPWVSFEDWSAAGNTPTWGAFLRWALSDATSMPRSVA